MVGKEPSRVPLLAWNVDLSVHIATLDAQHQRLVSLVNGLHAAMKEGKGREVLGDILDGLADYAVEHFRTEEQLFERHGYPMTAAHKAEHAAFCRRLAGFRKRMESGRVAVSIELLEYLNEWLEHHVRESDQGYSEFLTARGVR